MKILGSRHLIITLTYMEKWKFVPDQKEHKYLTSEATRQNSLVTNYVV